MQFLSNLRFSPKLQRSQGGLHNALGVSVAPAESVVEQPGHLRLQHLQLRWSELSPVQVFLRHVAVER